ncbi:MAG: hypothetical protein V9V01_00740 [Candidatus Shikimatogenerans sp. Tmey]
MLNNKIFKINNYKNNLKYIYIIQLIDSKLYKIFKYYNYKYLINRKLNILYNKIKNIKNILKKKKKKYILKYKKKKKYIIKNIKKINIKKF